MKRASYPTVPAQSHLVVALALLLIPVGAILARSVPGAETAADTGEPRWSEAQVWAVDSDGDSVADLVEALHGTDPFDPSSAPEIDLRDTDADGVPDQTEALHGTDANDLESFPVPELADSDQDHVPDFHEILNGTDPFTPDTEGLEQLAAPVGFPQNSCRSGFQRSDPISRMCIQTLANFNRTYDDAAAFCRDRESRVCSYEDLFYLYVFGSTDSGFNPMGAWIGNIVGDDDVLCGNRSITGENDPDQNNFEGTCNKRDNRVFWCCHDLDV